MGEKKMTTAKISDQSAHRLDRLQRRFHKSKIVLIDLALKQFEDQIFLEEINAGYARLKADKNAWNEELKERQELEGTIEVSGSKLAKI
jgi:predicted transcriptional regulator